MKRIALIALTLLTVTLAIPSPAAACSCIGGFLDKEFAKSASVFIGQVVDVSGPREVTIGSEARKFYVTRFFVWDRWKGAKAFDVEVLTELNENSGIAYPRMTVGETYLVFAQPVSVKNGSSKIQGIVTTCTLTSLLIGSGPEPEVRLNALATIFELDKLTKPAQPERTPAFGRKGIGKGFCLIC